MTNKMRAAAVLCGQGYSNEQIAEELDVTVNTVREWMRRDDVVALVGNATATYLQAIQGRAAKRLVDQVSDQNPWVAQNAAREVIRLAQQAQGIAQNTVNVSFAGMPEPGMPSKE